VHSLHTASIATSGVPAKAQANIDLTGALVSGELYLGDTQFNYFDFPYHFVPQGYGNSGSNGPYSIQVDDCLIEFGMEIEGTGKVEVNIDSTGVINIIVHILAEPPSRQSATALVLTLTSDAFKAAGGYSVLEDPYPDAVPMPVTSTLQDGILTIKSYFDLGVGRHTYNIQLVSV
jgi:hypothetical protein